ncbi:MAG TPA: alpha/beta fold hydrolase [Rhizomicrobium sp.]
MANTLFDTTVYFATNRNPMGVGFGANIADTDPTKTLFAAVDVSGTDLLNADSGVLGPITDRSTGTFGGGALNSIVNGADNLLIFIHGFANSFEDSIKRAAYNRAWFADGGAQGETAMVAFSWPSAGTIVDFGEALTAPYKADQVNAGNSGDHLAYFFLQIDKIAATFKSLRPNRRVFLLAHSMGNWALQAGVSAWYPQRTEAGPVFDEVILAAPDEHFTSFEFPLGQRLTRLPDLTRRTTIYYSGIDKILFMLSAPVNGVQRLGTLGPQRMNDETLYTASKFRMRNCGFVNDYHHGTFDAVHQYYRLSPKVRADIVAMMNGGPSGARIDYL